jgi:predicted dehydrogenase
LIVRFGLIGYGGIGRLRKLALDRSREASLTAVYDVDPARLADLDAGVECFAAVRELVTSGTCDAVIVSTPPHTHEELTLEALEAGRHVLVEKPMAPTPEACRRMVEAARRAGCVMTVGFNHRYFPAVRMVREAVQSGAIGRLSHVRGYAGHVGLAEFSARWMYDRDVIGGGTLWDNGIHMIDLVRHLLGEVRSVSGATGTRIWQIEGTEDNGFALLHGRDGITGTLQASWSEWKGYRFHVEAYGDRGLARAYYAPMMATLITMDRPGGKRRVRRRLFPGIMVREKLRGWQSTVIETFLEEHADFMALVRGRTPGPIARAEDGYRAVEIAAAIRSSAEAGQRVDLAAQV